MYSVDTKTKFSGIRVNWYCRILQLLTLGLMLMACSKSHANSAPANPLLRLEAYEIAAVYGPERIYTIRRNGKKIGTHKVSFENEADQLIVRVDSSLSVRILGIPVYRLSYVAEERWRDNTLFFASATTTENGDSNTVEWTRSAGRETQFASNHWHPGVLTGSSVFNTLTGEISKVTVERVGVENIENYNNELVAATHYRYEDDIQANVWYDQQGLWFRMAFQGEDGSAIEYLRID